MTPSLPPLPSLVTVHTVSPPLWKSLRPTPSPSATTARMVRNTHPHTNTLQHMGFLFLLPHWSFLAATPESGSRASAFAQQLCKSRTNQLCANPASLFCSAFCFFLLSVFLPLPASGHRPEIQAHWLFQRLTRLKPSLASTTAAGRVGSSPSRRELLCFCTSERLMTGGRDGITEWMDWCPTSTSWSKTSKTNCQIFICIDLETM